MVSQEVSEDNPGRDAGSGPYQIAGHSQSPRGNLATTSTLPYLMDFLPLVDSLALRTGLIIVPRVELLVDVQVSFNSEYEVMKCDRAVHVVEVRFIV